MSHGFLICKNEGEKIKVNVENLLWGLNSTEHKLSKCQFGAFPAGSAVKNPPAMQETWVGKFDPWVGKFDPWVGKFDPWIGKFDPWVGKFDPWVGKIPWRRKWRFTLQYSCLGKPMDGRAWQATDGGHQKGGHNWMTEQQQRDVSFLLLLLPVPHVSFAAWHPPLREHSLGTSVS